MSDASPERVPVTPPEPPGGESRARSGGRARIESARKRSGLSPKVFGTSVLLPIICGFVVLGVLIVAPGAERVPILGATLVAVASGLAATSIGVYGGVLVPGLLLLSVDARFAAAISLFLQILVIPLGAASHYRLGNVSRSIAIPLIVGGMIGAAIGPLFAAALPKDVIARIVAGMIILVGFVVLATLRWGGLGTVRAEGDVPRARVGAIGAVAGFSSGISGAGWGPIGVKLLILARIDPRQAIGSSLMGRIFMAATAVTVYVVSANAFTDVTPNWWLVIPLLAGSVAAMVPGAYLLSRLGRESATIGITLLSIVLALPTLIWG
ncbi:MAG: sulfite exporter TauE/SafE family protein [Chloroflexota bacterium]|nr:sulfite exporter TauE/SafE family protein [Chloroflexota bacterium]